MRGTRVATRAVVIAMFLAPLAFLVSGSLRRIGAPPPGGVELIPTGPSLHAFSRIGDYVPLETLVRNSAVVLAVAVPVTVLVASWAGFAMSQFTGRWRRWLLVLTVAGLMVPLPMVWIPRFVLYRELGILDTLVPLMAPALAATTPFTVLLAYRSFRRVPRELWDAARLEGAGALRVWWQLGVPLTQSTTAAIAAIAAAFHWGNFIDALLYTNSPGSRTLARGIPELGALDAVQLPITLAGVLLLVLPPALVVTLLQRRLLASVNATVDLS
jgi:multiple sugar transport system permease protein